MWELQILDEIFHDIHNELRIHVLRSQNIIPVELSPESHLDFKVSVAGMGICR